MQCSHAINTPARSAGAALARCGAQWHLGFYTWEHTPTFRGYDSFYGFYNGGQDYFHHTWTLPAAGGGARLPQHPMEGYGFDFHDEPSPRCGPGCSRIAWEVAGQYSTDLFTNRSVRIIQEHNVSEPLFL